MTAENHRAPAADDLADSSGSTDSGCTLPAPPRRSSQYFGKYEVVGEIGEGGMGRVYKAVDTELSRVVAIKVLRSADPFEAGRFRGEAEMIAALDHPNIIKVFDIATPPEGRPYIVLEFCEGGSLDRELGGTPQEPRRAAEMIETLARAVHFAHERGVIHRDLKPANVLRSKDKSLKLTDFGLAKELEVSSGMTPSGAVMGTPSYMSPEQAEGKVKQLGRPTDVYGLGAILYECLTGRPPFRGVNMVDTLEQVRWAEPAPPSRLVPRLHRDLTTICLKCLQKTPARRYQMAGELADDLRRWLNGETIAARPAPSWERAWRQVRRRPWQAATVTAIVLLTALLIGVLVINSERQRQKRAEDAQRDIKAKADDTLRETEKEAARKLQAKQEEHAQQLRERGARSRAALDAIRWRVTEGELKGTAGLHGLHGDLAGYYQKHIDESLADPGADRPGLAKLAYEIGELVHRSGRLDMAEPLFDKARAIYADLAAGDPKYRPRLGDALVKVARVLYDLNKEDKALSVCAEAEGLWEQIRKAPSAARDARDHATLQLAELAHVRGEVLRRRYQVEETVKAFTESIAYRLDVAKDYHAVPADKIRALPPDQRARAVRYLRELGRGYGYRGDDYLRLGQVTDADRDYWDSHLVREKVVAALADPKAPEDRAELETAQFQFARSWMNLAGFQTRHRAHTTAKQYAQKALKLREELVRASPNNAEYQLDLCDNLSQIAEFTLLERRDDPENRAAILDLLARAADTMQVAADEKSRTFRAREALAGVQGLRAEAMVDSDRPAALVAARDTLAFLADAQKLYPDHVGYQFQRVTMLALVADLDGVPPSDPRWEPVLAELKRVLVEKKYRDKHPADIKERRYFKKLKGDPRFEELFATLRS